MRTLAREVLNFLPTCARAGIGFRKIKMRETLAARDVNEFAERFVSRLQLFFLLAVRVRVIRLLNFRVITGVEMNNFEFDWIGPGW